VQGQTNNPSERQLQASGQALTNSSAGGEPQTLCRDLVAASPCCVLSRQFPVVAAQAALGLSVAKPRPRRNPVGQGAVILSKIFVLFAFLCGKNLSSEPPRLQFDFNALWFDAPFTVLRY
jgi:hypothetical protein